MGKSSTASKRKKQSSSSASCESDVNSDSPTRSRSSGPDITTTGNLVRQSMETLYNPSNSDIMPTSPPNLPLHTQLDPQVTCAQNSQMPTTPACAPPSVQYNTDMAAIMAKLEGIDSKLSKLDSIEADMSTIKGKVIYLESKIVELEKDKTRVNVLEESVKFISDSHDQTRESNFKIESEVEQLKKSVSACMSAIDELKVNNLNLKEAQIDARCRSMRDNLIFLNIPETEQVSSFTESEKVLRKFIEKELHLNSNMTFKRVHRIGRINNDGRPNGNLRPRPLIAKFVYTVERDAVKQAGKELKGKPFNIFEQFPEEVSKYRKEVLLPRLKEAKMNNQKAHITIDKLFINNKLQTGLRPPPYRSSRTYIQRK